VFVMLSQIMLVKVQSLVLSGRLPQIERLDTDSVLGVWGNKWIAS
jgi:hypothetical protein